MLVFSAAIDARPLWGWEVKRDVIAGTNLTPSSNTTASHACELLVTAPIPTGWKKVVLASANSSDTIYIWLKKEYPLIYKNGNTTLKSGRTDTAQKYERGGMIPLVNQQGKIGGYQVLSADAGVINLTVQGDPVDLLT